MKLLEDGVIGSTGRMIVVEIEKDGQMVKMAVPEPEEIHTFAEWKARGYYVRKGEKAVTKFTIWNFTNKPNKAAREAAKEAGEEVGTNPHYYMKESYFFTLSQTTAATKKMLPAVI
jgi:hypothetical protein